jgi:hypothetical protein
MTFGFSRREFLAKSLKTIGVAAGYCALEGSSSLARAASLKHLPPIRGWFGDSPITGHQFRNGELQAPEECPVAHGASGSESQDVGSVNFASEGTVDFVIVGGGMSGLLAAQRLKDENFLLLEQYGGLGGQSRGAQHNGLWYSYGAQYFNVLEGSPFLSGLLERYNLKAAKVINEDKSAFTLLGLNGSKRKSPVVDEIYRDIKSLREIVTPIATAIDAEKSLVPCTNSALMKLDSVPLREILKGMRPRTLVAFENFLKSSMCLSLDSASALSGAYVLSDIFEPSYALEGGNPALARAISDELFSSSVTRKRLRTGTFVVEVKVSDSQASVVYIDNVGQWHKVKCRHAIVTTPPLVTGRILRNVSNTAKGNLFWFRYGSFMLANVVCREQVLAGAFDTFLAERGTHFSDIVRADMPYRLNHGYNRAMGQVLTVYRPWLPGTDGRARLLEGNKEVLVREVLGSLEEYQPGIAEKVDEVVISRWGHAINAPVRGYYKKLSEIYQRNYGRQAGGASSNLAHTANAYSLCHSSLFGLQCLENAIQAGHFGAARALGQLE